MVIVILLFLFFVFQGANILLTDDGDVKLGKTAVIRFTYLLMPKLKWNEEI